MPLRVITGTDARGKTQMIIREICSLPENIHGYLIVPEQFGLEMQKELIEQHPKHGFFHLDVLSFHRLAFRIFEEQHFNPPQILEDLGISMLLRKILARHENDLVFFRRNLKKAGFIDELKSVLVEMIGYGIAPQMLHDAAMRLDQRPNLKEKCEELSMIYGWLLEETAGKYMITEQILHVAMDLMEKAAFLKDAVFYFDGFTGFTPVQLQFLSVLLKVAGQIHITVTIPSAKERKKGSEEVFVFSEKTISSLAGICKKTGTTITEVGLPEKSPKPGGEIAFLAENVFSSHYKVNKNQPEHIHITVCQNPDGEIDYILHKIEEIVRKTGARYRDFAILCGDVKGYAQDVRRRAGILRMPVFEDNKRKINYQAGIEAVRSLFHLALANYSYESVFRYLKSGLSDMEDKDVDFLENYVLSSGIRGFSMWKKPFTHRLSGYDKEEQEKLQELRKMLVLETETFYIAVHRKRCNVREAMTALFETMRGLQIAQKYEQKAREAEALADYDKAVESRELYPQLLGLLDKIVSIFGDEEMETSILSEIVDEGLNTLDIGIAPLSMDQVIFGDLKRTRLPKVKVLFVAGANDGQIPPYPGDGGIICDDEKSILLDLGVEMSSGLFEQNLENEFYMYLALKQPSDELYFTYSQTDSTGAMQRPSSFLASCERIYPALRRIHFPKEAPRKYFNVDDSREFLMAGLNRQRIQEDYLEQDKAFALLLKYWTSTKEGAEEIRSYWNMSKNREDSLPKDLVQELYGKKLSVSVTRLESFASCPYYFFCLYGLKLYSRELYEVTPIEMGNLFHRVMELYCNEVKKSGTRFALIPDNDRDRMLDKALDVAAKEQGAEVFGDSARNKHRLQMARRILLRTIEVLKNQLKDSDFEPDHFELSFGRASSQMQMDMDIDDNHRISFSGIIDRIDVCEEDNRLLTRLIDYKSGYKAFDLKEFYYGIQIQLVVYMNAVEKFYSSQSGKQVQTAGIFYYQIKDPIIASDHFDPEMNRKEFLLSGYASEESDILDHLEHGEDRFVSMSIRLKKDGTPFSNAKVLSQEQFELMGDYARKKMKEIGKAIYEGKIKAWPYLDKKKSACDYCPFSDVCGFVPGEEGCTYHRAQSLKTDEIFDLMRKED